MSSPLETAAVELERKLHYQFNVNNKNFNASLDLSTGDVIRQTIKEAHGTETISTSRLEREYLEDGPLTPLLHDIRVTEIIVHNIRNVVYERDGTLHVFEDQFLTATSFRNFLMRLCSEARIITNIEHPFANGRWRDFRVHIADLPCAHHGPSLCLRRIDPQPWNLDRLMHKEWCQMEQLHVLNRIFAEPANGLVIGTTGSGKTSVLNAFLQTLPSNRRVVLIEDTQELIPPNPVSIQLLTRHDPQGALPTIDQQFLVKQSLRMRPDSIVLGEVRGTEAKDLLLSWSTGHTQSWSSLHAETARQALLRLEMLIQLGAPQWDIQSVRNLILLSLRYLIIVERTATGHRRLKEVFQLISVEDSGFCIQKII